MDTELLLYILVGFAGQMVDGALGMAYGVTCSTFMMAMGLPPVTVSASVHAAEVFTTAASGLSHFAFKNIDKKLFLKLVIPGMIGGGVGAYVLSEIAGDTIKPLIAGWLMIMGILILIKSRRPKAPFVPEHPKLIAPLGLFGGFLDAIGGGGWGPVVVSNLVARGSSPRHVIGTVNLAEFFVTATISATFVLTIGFTFTKVVLGLLIGGLIAAPIAAFMTSRLPEKSLMSIVGVLIIVTSGYQIWKAIL
jgi:uncharacterized membrane protein YfcA